MPARRPRAGRAAGRYAGTRRHDAVEGLLPTDTKETVTGHAEIRQIFVYRKTKIGGCMVTDGTGRRDSKVRLVREVTGGRLLNVEDEPPAATPGREGPS